MHSTNFCSDPWIDTMKESTMNQHNLNNLPEGRRHDSNQQHKQGAMIILISCPSNKWESLVRSSQPQKGQKYK